MKKLSKKIITAVGTATLAVGFMALPALAQTTQQQGNGWFSKMHGYMQKTFSTEQHQALMNSTEMENLHNSKEMQNAMQTGDIKKMQEIMNSDPTLKAQVGQETLDRMNEFMNNSNVMMMTNGGGMTRSQGIMMNGGSRNSMSSQF